jgi:uncharacterized RDD family membrane protein YckC
MVDATDVVIVVLLVIPLLALLAIPTYNAINPNLGGVSFFYWYQILWMPLGALLYYIAAVLWNNKEKSGARAVGASARRSSRSRRRR